MHAGFRKGPGKDSNEIYAWERHFWSNAQQGVINAELKTFESIFIGHTPLSKSKATQPMNIGNIWNMDTGAGWGGVLSLMNVETKETWQSEALPSLYPNEQPRT